MTITVDAIYENGVLRPVQPLALAEQERVRVTVEAANGSAPLPESPSEKMSRPGPPLAERIAARAHALPPGALDRLPDDLAAEHDHYLYGSPKRSK